MKTINRTNKRIEMKTIQILKNTNFSEIELNLDNQIDEKEIVNDY